MDPEGRKIVVTGAAGGIGGALVKGLVARGARTVVATDLDVAGIEEGPNVVARALDVTDEQATQALVAEEGPIDVWFANAGLATGGGLEAGDDVWERQWRVNVLAHLFAARALIPGWVERGEGHLVTTASMAGLLSTMGNAAYAATKHAAVGFAEWLAFSYGAQGVKVSCICPGAVDTAMLRDGAGGDAVKAATAIGGGEVQSPDEAAIAVLDALVDDRFLIYTHPEMQHFVVGKAQDPQRWIRGMTKLWSRAQRLLSN